MIADTFVDLYARNAGLRDKLVAERDVVRPARGRRAPAPGRGLQPHPPRHHLHLRRVLQERCRNLLRRRRVVSARLERPRPFDPELFFARLRDGRYDWEDLRRLLRSSERLSPEDVLRSVETRFAMLRNLTELEQEVIADAKSGWNEPLAERLRAEIRACFTPAGA